VENQESKINMKSQNLIHILIGIVCIGLLPKAQAVVPPPDGGYPGANTAEGGSGALFSLTAGTNNTALGAQALFSLTTGNQNTATGSQALKNNTANSNTADGFQTLVNNTTGMDNTAIGWRALFKNTTGPRNTAIGYGALYRNGVTGDNTAVGFQAQYLSDGLNNTSIGFQALYHSGNDNNTAVGSFALFNNNAGSDNIALGLGAGGNITDGSENIDIGNAGVAGDANTIRIGTSGTHMATFIAGIGSTLPNGVPVVEDLSTGQLGIGATSSARFKAEIKPMDKASEALLALKPVTFRYKQEIDPKGIPQFGLVAEEVEKVNPDLVTRDTKGDVYTVRYEAVNAMLLNEFLKDHRQVQAQQTTIAQLKSMVEKQEAAKAQQQEQIEALTAGLQKLSAQLEASKSATQLVNNNQ
jgi:hypothetical protein